LQWLCSFWEPEGQIARWLQIIGEYQFKVQHREGKRHGNADGLSRQGLCKQCGKLIESIEATEPVVTCPEKAVTRRLVTNVRAITLTPEWTPNQLAAWQENDDEIRPVLLAIRSKRDPEPEEVAGWPAVSKRLMNDWERLRCIQGVLYRIWYDKHGREKWNQLITPRQIRPEVLKTAHEGEVAGHYAQRQTVQKVQQHFYWPRMQSDVRHFCQSCEVCQRRRAPPKRPQHPLQQDRVGEPMQKMSIDILGFDRRTARGNRYILVIVDSLTKWAEAVPMADEKAETVANALVEHVVCRLGIPSQLHSDQGRQFESEVFQKMCEILGIRKTRTTPMNPASNGSTERMNRTILDLLAKMAVENPNEWDLKLPFAMAAYRSTPHSTTGETPNRLMLGREVTTPLRLLAPAAPDEEKKQPWIESLHENFAEAHSRVQDQIEKSQRIQKQSYDSRAKFRSYEIGQKVYIIDARPRRGFPRKLNPWRWRGPYEIRQKLSSAVYVIAFPGARNTIVVSADRLKNCVDRAEEWRQQQEQDVTDEERRSDCEISRVEEDKEERQCTRRPQRKRYHPVRYDEYQLNSDGAEY
jgi:transposase InsO family protein